MNCSKKQIIHRIDTRYYCPTHDPISKHSIPSINSIQDDVTSLFTRLTPEFASALVPNPSTPTEYHHN